MGRAPCCDKANVKRGPWSLEEDSTLKNYIERYGTGGNWMALPKKADLKRCGKSCRLRWLNYLRPNIKHGEFSDEEDRIIFNLVITIGSRWSIIAAQLPGRTDNDIKNYWNTKLKKKLMGLLPNPHRKPQPQPQPIPLPKPRTSTTITTPTTHPSLLFSSSIHIQPSQQQLAQPQAAVSPYYHSYVSNYTFPSDNSTTTTTATTTTTTTSSIATVNSDLNSCYLPFSMKDQEFVDFGSDPRNCNSHVNQQMMMGTMIKQEEEVVHHDGFEFEFDQMINQWAETMSECCFGTEFDLISGRGTNLIDRNHNHHHGINKLGAEEMGLYY